MGGQGQARRRRERSGLVRWLLVAGILLATATAWSDPANGPAPAASAIAPDEGERVMNLVTPWRDGAEVAPGLRFVGAAIDKELACYLFEGARKVEACLLPKAGGREVPSTNRLPLPGGASLVLRAPPDPTAAEVALLGELHGLLTRNAESHGLAELWHQPLINPRGVQQLVTFPAAWGYLIEWLEEPMLWLIGLLLWVVLASRAAVSDLPGRGWPHVAVLLAYSVLTRWTLPIDAPMTAWSWKRLTTIGHQVIDSVLIEALVSTFVGPIVTLDAVQSVLARVLSIATPLALLGHGRKLFGSSHAAFATAALLAASPHALRFAAADTQFNTSMFWSSVAFFWVYCALEASRPLARLAYALGLAPLLMLAMTARPLNLVYGPLMISALWIATSRDKVRWRTVLAVEVAAVFAWATWDLMSQNSASVESALVWASVLGALELLLNPDYNPLFFWRLTPPIWPVLIGIGVFALVRGPWRTLEPAIARRRGIWLVCWLFGYIALHGVVVVEEPMNNARYQLHSLPAMAMLAGAGLWALWSAWSTKSPHHRAAAIGAALVCAAAPWLHQASIQDVGFATMQQRLFLREMVETAAVDGRIPPGCTTIEVMRPLLGPPVSKMQRAGRLAPGGAPDGLDEQLWQHADVQHWTEHPLGPDGRELAQGPGGGAPDAGAIQAGAAPPSGVQGAALANVGSSIAASHQGDREHRPDLAGISERGRALLARPPSCLVFFESAECALEPGSTKRHPACEEILASGRWQLIAERKTVTRIYDAPLMLHLRANGDPLELRMWRRTF